MTAEPTTAPDEPAGEGQPDGTADTSQRRPAGEREPGATSGESGAGSSSGEVRDSLPEDLDRGFVGPYTFPGNQRRRIQGAIHITIGAVALVLAIGWADGGVLVDAGVGIAGAFLVLVGLYHVLAGVRADIDENDALLAATRAVGFAVGHASAQLGWRGLRSRPTWRVLVYSAENPPAQRGLVLVDGVDGGVVDQLVELNPEDEWDG